ncbi:MAG: TolC family protein [Bacteroidia bacterium]|nr:TolC family protein [Bacteroidia bacterium]
MTLVNFNNTAQLKHVRVYILFAIYLVCMMFSSTHLYAQKQLKDSLVYDGVSMVPYSSIPVDTILFNLFEDLGKQMMPLDSILEYAVKYSPVLRMEDAAVQKAHYNLKYTRYLFLNGFSGFFNYTYGNQTNLNSINSDGSVLNNSLGLGYRVGANITIPLTEVFARPARIKSLKAEHDMAKYKRLDVEITVREKVIANYFNLLASQKMVSVRQQDAESARLTVEISNVEMRRGKIHPQELSRLKNILAIAESNLELSKRDFMVYYYQLETLMGTKLQNLKRGKAVKKK